MSHKRSEAAPAKTGRTWSPLKGLTMTERGPLQVQARVRRTGRPPQTKTFESVAEAEAWGLGVLDGFNRNTFVDRRRETRTTLANVLERYKETGLTVLKSRVQARSQVDQLLKSSLAQRFVGEIESADIIAWLRERRAATVRRKKRDVDGRVVRIEKGRRLEIQYEDVTIGEKTVLNELMRLSAAFVFARVEMGLQGLRNPVEDVPVKDKPKRRERSRRLRGDEEQRLLTACRESRCKPLAAIVELAWETACRRGEIINSCGGRISTSKRTPPCCAARNRPMVPIASGRSGSRRGWSRSCTGFRRRPPAPCSPIAPTASRETSVRPASAPASRISHSTISVLRAHPAWRGSAASTSSSLLNRAAGGRFRCFANTIAPIRAGSRRSSINRPSESQKDPRSRSEGFESLPLRHSSMKCGRLRVIARSTHLPTHQNPRRLDATTLTLSATS
jgi:hypothetical protein